ncbi:hypothetical protein K443DRAFT_348864 [Laccaria amethystina LaAM-08-1]|uniref:Unplaced genomic scaffold K443scaffold_243, whole genome shotgun sequence n=1 Tax=Laccaria amethystina LaAM-08-1 TaxID=1095629 RepID=A0A0C9XAN4_9AGAR|nr:hypothetical protein K443DRAFT_348864 [Laccaria amethystina LaAM-08-1]
MGPGKQLNSLLSLALIDMVKDNSQSSKSSSMFNTFRQHISPAPSEQSQGYSSKSRSPLRKLFSKSRSTTPTQSTSYLQLVSSTVDSRGETTLDQPKSLRQQATLTTTSLDRSRGEKAVTYYVDQVHNIL